MFSFLKLFRGKTSATTCKTAPRFQPGVEALEDRQLLSATPAAIASALTHSPENYANFITGAYRQYLGRTPDTAGLTSWVNAMQGGLSDEQLEASFIGSAEYIRDHGGTGPAWVNGMYHDLLGRNADAAGLNHWVQALQAGAAPDLVAYGFAASAEREGQRIAADYLKYLGRRLDAAGQAYWVDQFVHHGASNEDVVAGFVSSPEYYNRAGGNADIAAWLVSAFRDVLGRTPSDQECLNLVGKVPDHPRGPRFQINPDDIDQREANTCAFLSTLSAVARANPAELAAHIKQDTADPLGGWDVQLFINNAWRNYHVVIGQVTPADPSPDPILGQNKGPGGQNMWVVACQRAYFQAMGVTDPLSNSPTDVWRQPDVALEALTGILGGSFRWTLGNAPSTFSWGTLHYLFTDPVLKDAITAECPTSSTNVRVEGIHTLVGSHEYSVVGVIGPTLPGQQAIVMLRNPWGCNPNGDQRDGTLGDPNDPVTKTPDGGYLYVTWAQFINYFDAVYFSTTNN
jgi:hypothetical protein